VSLQHRSRPRPTRARRKSAPSPNTQKPRPFAGESRAQIPSTLSPASILAPLEDYYQITSPGHSRASPTRIRPRHQLVARFHRGPSDHHHRRPFIEHIFRQHSPRDVPPRSASSSIVRRPLRNCRWLLISLYSHTGPDQRNTFRRHPLLLIISLASYCISGVHALPIWTPSLCGLVAIVLPSSSLSILPFTDRFHQKPLLD
jgi:hypothetical protein